MMKCLVFCIIPAFELNMYSALSRGTLDLLHVYAVAKMAGRLSVQVCYKMTDIKDLLYLDIHKEY